MKRKEIASAKKQAAAIARAVARSLSLSAAIAAASKVEPVEMAYTTALLLSDCC